MIHLLDDNSQVIEHDLVNRSGRAVPRSINRSSIAACSAGEAVLWDERQLPLERFSSGMTATLQHGEQI